jgi:hypothetical protein
VHYKCDLCTIIAKCVGCSTEQDPSAQSHQYDAYNAKNDTLYRAYLWATIIGVVVALSGIFAIYRQTKATAQAAQATKESAEATLRSAKAAERSVKLTENTQRQWVNLEDWAAFKIKPTDTGLELGFNVVNPTTLPLTLHTIITRINGKPTESEGPVTLITPSNPLIHGFRVPLTKEQESLYANNVLSLDIVGTILFADSHGIHWSQEFGRMLLCGSNLKTIITDTKNTLQESGVPGERGSRDAELPH